MTGAVHTAARAIAVGRVAIGATLVAAPQLAAPWAGDEAGTAGGRLLGRALGARDAALGLGTLASANDPAQLRRWLVMSGGVDAVDLAATLAGPRSPARTVVVAIAAGAAVASFAAAAATS